MQKKSDKEKLKVLMVAGHMNVGGLENQLMHVLRNADKNCFQIDFTSFMPDAFFRKEIEQSGSSFILIPDMNWKKPWEYCIAMYRVMKNGNYDVVHSHELFHSGITLTIARCAGVPCRFVHAHNWNDGTGIGERRSIIRTLYNKVMRTLILLNSTQQIACSSLAGEFVYGKKATTKDSYHLIYNSVDTNKFIEQYDNSETGEFVGDDWKNILHVGRVTRVKNQRFLIDIARIFKAQRNKIRILCAGSGEEDEWNYLNSKIKEFQLQDHFVLLGVRDDIDVLMRKSDCFVLPSLYEGMPLVLIEAQAAGLPCVVADTFSHEVEFDTHQIAWLNLKESANMWAATVENESKRGRQNKSSVKKAIKKGGFDSKIFTEKICSLYKKDFYD